MPQIFELFKMGPGASWEQEVEKAILNWQTLELAGAATADDVPSAAPDPWASRTWGDGPGAHPALWPTLWASYTYQSYVGFPQAYPAPWTYTWVPTGGYQGMGHLCGVPSIWSRDASSLPPCLGGHHPYGDASSEFPPFGGPPAPHSSPSPSLASHCPQGGWKTPVTSSCRPKVRSPARGAPYLKRCRAPPPEWSSRFSIWVPRPPSSPELCPLPPSPAGDPQPRPRGPQHPSRLPCRVRRCLFESSSNSLSVPPTEFTPTSPSSEDTLQIPSTY